MGIWEKLRYSQKFAIIAVIFALPVIFFIPISLSEQYEHINEYGIKEQLGTEYLRILWEVKNSVQDYDLVTMEGAPRPASEADIEDTRAKINNSLNALLSAEEKVESLQLNFSANELIQTWSAVGTAEDSARFLDQLTEAIREVGDKSNLVLDPDLDTYYLMDAVLFKLQDNQNRLYQISATLTNTRNKEFTDEERIGINNHASTIRRNLIDLKRNIDAAAENNTNQAINPALQAELIEYANSIESYLSLVEMEVAGANPDLDELNARQKSAITSSSNFYFLASDNLEQGIRNRIQGLILQTTSLIALLIVSSLGAYFAGNRLMQSIGIPIQKTAQAAVAFSAGDYSARVDYSTGDESGLVVEAFNKLAEEVEAQQKSLKIRTEELENKTRTLETISKVAREITSYRDISSLLGATTSLIHENFGHYHVGIFLLDERKEYAVLTATNSEGGRKMLEKGHLLKIGETGIVGYVAENLRARIALDVGEDAVYFNNPDLPNTRSEMALPLVAGGQILGVLDVQSTEPKAFDEDDISTLQILAEQIAVAIQNANLFSDAEKALDSARATYGQMSREAWSKMLRARSKIDFLATPPATIQIQSNEVEPSISKAIETGDLILGSDGLTISVPVKIRGQVIGAIRLKKAEIAEAWTQDETNLAISLSDQLSGALESARLYRETLQRASRESLVSDISARINASSTRDAIVRETVQELGQSFANTSITFQLLDQLNGANQAEGPGGTASRPMND